MKHIIKVNNILDAMNNPIRPILALDSNGNLFAEGASVGPTMEFVDLGLSVKWAKCNLGAETETDYGDYYAWGEITTKSNYSRDTYEFGFNSPFSKYDEDGKTELELADDVANASLGGSWRMPTKEEFVELCDTTKVTNEWVTKNGINGREFTSLINGNILFIPAAGYYDGLKLSDAGEYCWTWSSSLTLFDPDCAHFLYFYNDDDDVDPSYFYNRYCGLSVRPVFKD